jgi:hypothetical protein
MSGGGVLVADRRRIIAVDLEGRIQWNDAVRTHPQSWGRYKAQLLLSTGDGLVTADQEGLDIWGWQTTGLVSASGEDLYLYAEDGLYRADFDIKTGILLKELEGTILDQAAISPAGDRGLVLIHTNGHDRRLLLIDFTGRVVWERSLSSLSRGSWYLFSDQDDVYLMHTYSVLSNLTVDIYVIDLESAVLTHIIRTGSRRAFSRNTWLDHMGDGLWLLNTDGGPLGAFDLQAAYERITQP